MLLAQVSREMGRIVLVRGLPKGGAAVKSSEGLIVFDYLSAGELGRVIRQSKLVLARSGYSTVMDLVRMGKKAIYVPTPGQPEQEYLGRYLEERGLGVCMRQRGFVLEEATWRGRGLQDGGIGGKNDLLGEEIRKVLAQSMVGDLG